MRSAFSLTLVLIAAMSGHSASACEPSQHALRLLMSPALTQCLEQGNASDSSFTTDLPSSAATELRVAAPVCTYIAPSPEPASRSYEAAHGGGVPSRGP